MNVLKSIGRLSSARFCGVEIVGPTRRGREVKERTATWKRDLPSDRSSEQEPNSDLCDEKDFDQMTGIEGGLEMTRGGREEDG